MSVPSSNANRFPAAKPAALYLMELRQHVAATQSRRQKLAVDPWGLAERIRIPIRGRTVTAAEEVRAG